MRKGAKNDEELYHNCWLNKWKCNHANPNNGLKYLLSRFFWVKSNTTINCIINISATHAFKAKANIDVANNNSCAL